MCNNYNIILRLNKNEVCRTDGTTKRLQIIQAVLNIDTTELEIKKLKNELEEQFYKEWERKFSVRVREIASGICVMSGIASLGFACYNAITAKGANIGQALIHPPWFVTGVMTLASIALFLSALLVKPRYS